MARAAEREPGLRFRGTPAALAAVFAERVDPEQEMFVSVPLAGPKKPPVEATVQTDFDPRILRLSLPADVPPGAYPGSLRVGNKKRPVVLEVDPAPRLHVVPEQLRVEAHPGDLVGVDLTVLNQGNVPVELRAVQAIGVFMSGGIERALRRAYVKELSPNQRRMDVIADSLADAHGGLLRMKIEQGAGPIAPGQVRELHVVLHVPTGLERGAMYGGNWEVPGLVYPISIFVAGEPPVEDPAELEEPVKVAAPSRAKSPRKARKKDTPPPS